MTDSRVESDGNNNVDVVIAGGGMVGASLGCALSCTGLAVAVVEPYPPSSNAQPSFDARTTALSRSSFRILDTLGIWDEVDEVAQPIRSIHVSERKRFGTAIIDASTQGVDTLGYVVENRVLGQVLWGRLADAENIALHCPDRIVSVDAREEGVSVETAEGTRFDASLLVVADGARSDVRDMVGIEAEIDDYGQTAIVGNIAVDPEYRKPIAYERFAPGGPIAMLPMTGGRYTFVFTRRTDEADDVLALDDSSFVDLLQREFGYRLGMFSKVGKRHAYPLSLVRSTCTTVARCAVIGNAAHGLHPVAGQGFNLGLRDVAALAELLVDASRNGGDPGAEPLLEAFGDWRQTDQRNVVAFTDGLIRLFGVRGPVSGALRGIGVSMFDILPSAKRALAHHTMGLSGRLSRLARGLEL